MEYYVCREDGEPVNTLVWFGNQKVQGCSNALILEGGDLILLKEIKRYSVFDRQHFRDGKGEYYQAWVQEFGTKQTSDFLRSGIHKQGRRKEWWQKLKEQIRNA